MRDRVPHRHVGGPVFEPLQVAVLLTLVATAYSFRALITVSARADRSRLAGRSASRRACS